MKNSACHQNKDLRLSISALRPVKPTYLICLHRGVIQLYRLRLWPNSKANQYWLSMFQARATRDNQGTLNFSALGLPITTGAFIVTLSYVLESVTASSQRHSKTGTVRAAMWQTRWKPVWTLRSVFKSHRRGTWHGSEKLIPITSPAEEILFCPRVLKGLPKGHTKFGQSRLVIHRLINLAGLVPARCERAYKSVHLDLVW